MAATMAVQQQAEDTRPRQLVVDTRMEAQYAETVSSASSTASSICDGSEGGHESASSASSVADDDSTCPSPISPTSPTSTVFTIEKEKQSTGSPFSSSPDLEAQLNEVDSSSQKRLGFLRYTALNVYWRLFSIAFIGNVIAFIVLAIKGTTTLDLVNASAINLAVCGLCRQPLVINALFLTFGALPRSTPMRLRRLACKVFHFGGVHSGTGVASCLWYIGFAALYTYEFRPSKFALPALVLIWMVLALLLAIIFVAYPTFRIRRHDYFELTHRFANWLILVIFWALLFLLACDQQLPLDTFLINLPAFWILIILTCATIHPWLLLRRVPVVAEPLSDHAIRLHFTHTTIRFGQGISVARHPLRDWHSFASFTDQFDSPNTKFSVLVSEAGDWTKDCIANPPKCLWKRGVPTYGFGYVFRMFERIIVVTTGSGIGPCLSFLEDEKRPAMRVVWQTKSPLKTYGSRTLDLAKKLDEKPVVIDTSVSGRVDMLPIVLKLYKEFDAQAVCVISNMPVTKGLVYALETRGIAAYGPIFDS